MPKGDIVLIPFPYTDLSGSKLRPAVVLIEDALDVTVSFITTQLQWQEPTDILLKPSKSNGIKKTSLVRVAKISTIKRTLVLGKMGTLDQVQLNELDLKLRKVFQL
jgi:mRNA interferase MazF